jgi:hypothetical protein
MKNKVNLLKAGGISNSAKIIGYLIALIGKIVE